MDGEVLAGAAWEEVANDGIGEEGVVDVGCEIGVGFGHVDWGFNRYGRVVCRDGNWGLFMLMFAAGMAEHGLGNRDGPGWS